MAKVTLSRWASKKGPDGLAPICLIIRHQKKRSILELKIRVLEKDWNKKQSQVRKGHAMEREFNEHLSVWRSRAQRMLDLAIVSREGVSASKIIGDLRAIQRAEMGSTETKQIGDADDFLLYFRQQLERYEARRQWATFEAYRVAYNKLAAFVESRTGQAHLHFDDVDVHLLEDFRTHLISHYGNATNTVHKNLTSIRTILYQAIREDRFPQERNPFFRLQLKKKKGSRHYPISIEKIWEIEDLDLAEHHDDARNAFLIAFYEGGVRIADVIQMQSSDIIHDGNMWVVEYDMEKTGKPSESFPLWPPAEKVLRKYGWPELNPDDYIFPYFPKGMVIGGRPAFDQRKKKTSLINKHLKAIQRMVGIETPLTTHVARHSFGSRLDQEGWEIQAIQRLLRHSDPQTTQIYIDSMRSRRYDDRLKKALLPER